jgi:hypothetical protein
MGKKEFGEKLDMKCVSGKPHSAWRVLSTDRTEHHLLRYFLPFSRKSRAMD